MSDDEQELVDNKFKHRKQCSNRVFIGPWDIKASSSPEHLEHHEIESLQSIESDSSMKNINYKSSLETRNTGKGQDSKSSTAAVITPTSDGTSFLTARSGRTNSTTYSSAASTPRLLEQFVSQEYDDEEIDYQFLKDTPISDDLIKNDSETESIKTIRPTASSSKCKLPVNQTSSPTTTTLKKRATRKIHRLKHRSKKPLLWKRSGSVFVSHIPASQERNSVPTGKPIKRDPILCMRSISSHGSEPSRYKASKEARFDLLTEKWRQVELVLTNSYISTYVSSKLYWPKQKLEHRIHLEGSKRPKHLELFLLSPLDYTFCLRYSSYSPKKPMTVTLKFKARSFLKCQEWYMQLYDLLPTECKRPCPKWCEVYIPMLDLSVNLPLADIKHSDDITLEDVKEAVLTVLEEDDNETVHENMKKLSSAEELGLCWATKDRAEWVYWITSSSDAQRRIDWVICPQSIEQTHRLELRTIQHTPHDIILKEDFVLKEPSPVEGFLTCVTDFFGGSGGRFAVEKLNYFASFDQYLFYIPQVKVPPPNMACFVEPELMPKNIRSRPYISSISPYTPNSTPEIEFGEIHRRMQLMIEAKGVIDLTEVSYVRRSFTDDDLENFGNEDDSRTHLRIGKKSSQTPIIRPAMEQSKKSSNFFQKKPKRDKPCLEIIMDNGLQIKFEAYSSDTCDLWVNYLAQLIVYWKARKEAEKDAHTIQNFGLINEPKMTANTLIKDKTLPSTEDGCIHNREDSVADTRIWSYCFYEQCRDVVKSGILYYKPHNRGTYSQKMFVLTANGWILFYDIINRNTDKKCSNHERKGAIDIAGCYFYSGVDSSKKKKGSNRDNLLKKAARLYGNGLATDDDTLSCIFSIWKPKLRRFFSTKRQRLQVYRHDQRLNPTGSTWTFLARSRREKEEWVCALNTITEHMIRCNTR